MKTKLMDIIDEETLTPEEAAIKKEDLKNFLLALKAKKDHGKEMSSLELEKQDLSAITFALTYEMASVDFDGFRITEGGEIALAELVEADRKEE